MTEKAINRMKKAIGESVVQTSVEYLSQINDAVISICVNL
jgi:hypothetical protein